MFANYDIATNMIIPCLMLLLLSVLTNLQSLLSYDFSKSRAGKGQLLWIVIHYKSLKMDKNRLWYLRISTNFLVVGET